jgi:peptidoglycan hydrolase-like protein with peptidoglycan-binding domain
MARVQWRGVTLDERTAAMMNEVARLTPSVSITPTQGSYSSGVGASAGTHNGGGAIDISVRGMDAVRINALVRNMRRVGFAAWFRDARAGVWGAHVHGVAVDCRDLASVAERQVEALRDGRNGLADNGPDPHAWMHMPVTTWERYKASLSTFPLPDGHSFGTPKSTSVHDGTANPTDAKSVQRIQQRLRVKATGKFGPVTRTRVAAWQAWKRIPATGRVGATTWKRLGL